MERTLLKTRRLATAFASLLLAVGGAIVTVPPASAATTGYPIIDDNSNQCLGIQNASTIEGAGAIQWNCDGFADQDWRTTENPVGEYDQYVNANSGQCLGIQGASTIEGANVIQWNCDGFLDQDWR